MKWWSCPSWTAVLALALALVAGRDGAAQPAPAATAPATAAAEGKTSIATDPRVLTALDAMRVWLEAQRAYDEIPGVSAAIVYDQQVLWSGGFGLSDLERKTAATDQTIYSICSISKLFTSLAVMQQRDAGKLRLDDPVAKLLPWFRITRTNAWSPEITVEGLLTHASGLPRESDQSYWTTPFVFPTHDEIVSGLAKQETLYPAETYFQYSNLGLTLAGEVASAAAGEPYAAYIKRSILDPLGLASTTPEMPSREKGGRLATGYSAIMRDGARQPVPFFETRGIAPAAGFASTATDLARFASWQFRLLDSNRTEVIAANTLREMQRVHWVDPDFETTWGLGFSVWRSKDKTFVGHGGSCPGYRTQLLLRPDEKVATIFMANALGVNSQQFAQRLYEFVAPAIKTSTDPDAPPLKPADRTLDAYLGTYSASFGGEIAVIRWADGLALLPLPNDDPVAAIVKLKKVSDHTFRRVRKDDALGETMVFEVGADGKATRIRWNSNYFPRMR